MFLMSKTTDDNTKSINNNEFQESLKRSITKPSNLQVSENIVSAIRKKCISDDVGGIFENDEKIKIVHQFVM